MLPVSSGRGPPTFTHLDRCLAQIRWCCTPVQGQDPWWGWWSGPRCCRWSGPAGSGSPGPWCGLGSSATGWPLGRWSPAWRPAWPARAPPPDPPPAGRGSPTAHSGQPVAGRSRSWGPGRSCLCWSSASSEGGGRREVGQALVWEQCRSTRSDTSSISA